MHHGVDTANPLLLNMKRQLRLLLMKDLKSNSEKLMPLNSRNLRRNLKSVATPPSNSSRMESQ